MGVSTLGRVLSSCNSDSDPAAATCPVSPLRHGGHGDFTEASGFSVHLRVLRVSVVNKVLEFLSSPDKRRGMQLKARVASFGVRRLVAAFEVGVQPLGCPQSSFSVGKLKLELQTHS